MKKQILFWTPRILAILVILFMMVFSADCFDNQEWQQVMICLFMHNIPSFILVAATIVAWKWELAGGLLLILVSFSGGFLLRVFSGNLWALLFVLPLLLAGILFIINHIQYGNNNGSEKPED